MIQRNTLIDKINESLADFEITAIIGPRQCGKTTVARMLEKELGASFFDLEDPKSPLRPEVAANILEPLNGLVIIDEIQLQPALFNLLRVLADREERDTKFLILGSASPHLIKNASESLAGRVQYIEMDGFDVTEIKKEETEKRWIQGGYPKSFLAATEKKSMNWRENFIRTYLERDIPQLGIRIPSTTIRRFWVMLAHFHGNIWNAAEFARSLGTKEDSARRYLDILTGTFMVHQLNPWFENVGKRLVKAPKIYIRDSGLLHALLGLESKGHLMSHPKLGYSWEGYMIHQIINILDARRDSYFYKAHSGSELDLLIFKGGKRYGFELKFADSVSTTKSMHEVIKDLNLERLWVVYPGNGMHQLKERIYSLPANKILELPILLPLKDE